MSQRNILFADPAPSQSVTTSLPAVQELSNANCAAKKVFIDRKNKAEEADGNLLVACGIRQLGAARKRYPEHENNRNVLHARLLLPTRENCRLIHGRKCARPDHQNKSRKLV
jgi:hypothetical protein